ncbi:MAG: transcription factor [Promethearchaeota archaeon]
MSKATTNKRLSPLQRSVLKEIGGKECIDVAKQLLNLTNEATDEEIADMTSIKLNLVRKILYRLNENKLAIFRRIRDKKSGWFIYYWRENLGRARELVTEKQRDVLEKLELRVQFERENQFFMCSNRENCNNERYSFYEAMELGFECPECEMRLEFTDNSKVIEMLDEKIAILKSELRKRG